MVISVAHLAIKMVEVEANLWRAARMFVGPKTRCIQPLGLSFLKLICPVDVPLKKYFGWILKNLKPCLAYKCSWPVQLISLTSWQTLISKLLSCQEPHANLYDVWRNQLGDQVFLSVTTYSKIQREVNFVAHGPSMFAKYTKRGELCCSRPRHVC